MYACVRLPLVGLEVVLGTVYLGLHGAVEGVIIGAFCGSKMEEMAGVGAITAVAGGIIRFIAERLIKPEENGEKGMKKMRRADISISLLSITVCTLAAWRLGLFRMKGALTFAAVAMGIMLTKKREMAPTIGLRSLLF